MNETNDSDQLPVHLMDKFHPHTDGARYRRTYLGRIENDSTPDNRLPKRNEVIDWRTGKPKRGHRFKGPRGNIVVKH